MGISREDAREIVSEISKLLGAKMNIMDSNGIIIASSDKSRIGSFHKAAYEIIKNNLSEYEITEEDHVEGALPGNNLPIYNDDKIIGVVGITGDSAEINKYNSIVQKMTEILVQGKIREANNQKKQSIVNNFLFDWVFNEDESENHRLISKGLELGIDITLQRRILIFAVADNSQEIEKQIVTFIKLKHKENLVFKSSDYLIALVLEEDEEELKLKCDELLAKVNAKNAVVHIAGSSYHEANAPIRKLYLQALKAYEVAKNSKESNVVFYSHLSIELVLNNLGYDVKSEIVKKVFSSLDRKSMKEYLPILKSFYKSNGSLKATSKDLNIHVNTIQYHLNKMKQKTGYDARNYNDSILIQIAIRFLEETKEK